MMNEKTLQAAAIGFVVGCFCTGVLALLCLQQFVEYRYAADSLIRTQQEYIDMFTPIGNQLHPLVNQKR